MKTFKLLVALISVLAAVYLAAALMLTQQEQTPVISESVLDNSNGATSIIENFQHIESQLDKTSLEIQAKKAELIGERAHLTGITMRFYTPENEIITLTGKKGIINLSNKNVLVEGDIEAVYDKSYFLYSKKIIWDAKLRRLTSYGPVRIVGPEGEIRGSIMLAKPDTKAFVVEGGVTVDFKGNLRNYMGNLSGVKS